MYIYIYIHTHNFFHRSTQRRAITPIPRSKGHIQPLSPPSPHAVSRKFSVSNQRILIEHESISSTGFVINPVLRAWTFKRATIPSCVHLYCPSNWPSLPCLTLVLQPFPIPYSTRFFSHPRFCKLFDLTERLIMDRVYLCKIWEYEYIRGM